MNNRPRSERRPRDNRKAHEMTLDERKFAMQRCCQRLDALVASGRGATPAARRTRHAMWSFAGKEMWSALSFARPQHYIDFVDDLT